MSFAERLGRGIAETDGRLCVGLDPHPTIVPEEFGKGAGGAEGFLRWIIDQTHPHACCYKPNSAFFEAMGPEGAEALRTIVSCAHEVGRPVIVDAKRGDIASTGEAYAAWAKRVVGADAVTVVPYMGEDAVQPFLDEGLFAYVLALPSNPSAEEIACYGEPPLCTRVASLAARLELEYRAQVGLVVGATQAAWVAAVHAAAPSLPWLVPGVGAQGGDLGVFRDASRDHQAMVISASRSILGSADPAGAARALKLDIERRLR